MQIQTVNRIDHCKIDGWEETPEGYVKARVIAGRTGCQTYYYDGIKFVEYRSPQEVFSPNSFQTLDNKAFTDEHPPVMLTAENTKDYARGFVLGPTKPYQDRYLETYVLITDAETIGKIKDGLAEVSCGYTCDVVKQPGTAPDGTKYDGYQTNIRYNHLSRVNRGRAGSEVRVRFDAAIQEEHNEKQGVLPMEMTKIKLDAGEFDIPSAAAVAIHAELKQLRKDAEDQKALATKAKSDLDALQGKYDQAKTELADAKAKLDAVPSADVVEKLASELANVRVQAQPFLKQEDKVDGLSVIDLKKLALANHVKDLPQDKSDAYYEARFDAMIESAQNNPTPPQFQRVIDAATGQEGKVIDPNTSKPHVDAYQQQVEDLIKMNQGVKA